MTTAVDFEAWRRSRLWSPAQSSAGTAAAPARKQDTAPTTSTWALDHVADLLAQPSPTEWLVRGFLDAHALAVLFGPSGCGKSFLGVGLACCVATGTSWHAHAVKRGDVVYLAGEGHHGIRKRFLAWSIEHDGITLGGIHVSRAAIDLAGEVNRIIAAIRDACAKPSLVVVDTLHRHLRSGANENSGEDVGPFIAAADLIRHEVGCAVLLVHHTGHMATDRERGWSGLRGAVDWAHGCMRGDSGPLIVSCRKAKDHEPEEPLQLGLHSIELPWLDDEGHPERSAVLRITGRTEAGMGGNQLLAMTALRKLVHAEKGEPIPVAEWRKASGVDRRRWHEVQTALVERGLILLEGDHVRIP